jgi:uncharacterized protein DUF3551
MSQTFQVSLARTVRVLASLGLVAAIICLERPAGAQNGAWCIYKNGDGDGGPQCRYATLQQCLADRLGSSTCSPSPYPLSPEAPVRRADKRRP